METLLFIMIGIFIVLEMVSIIIGLKRIKLDAKVIEATEINTKLSEKIKNSLEKLHENSAVNVQVS